MRASFLFVASLLLAGCATSANQQTAATRNPPSPEDTRAAGTNSAPAPAAAAPVDPANDRRPAVAVFPFRNGSFGSDMQNLETFSVGVQEMVGTELKQNSSLRIIERQFLREILDEIGFQQSAQVDPQTAVRVGKQLGANYVVLGSFSVLPKQFVVTGRIVNVETGEWLNAEKVDTNRDDMYQAIVQLAARLPVGVNLPAPPRNVVAARMERKIPPEAITLYSRAQVYADAGRTEQAVQLYRQIAQQFPQMTEAQEALRQLGSGS